MSERAFHCCIGAAIAAGFAGALFTDVAMVPFGVFVAACGLVCAFEAISEFKRSDSKKKGGPRDWWKR